MDHGQHADPTVVTGKLLEQSDQMIVLALPGTDYKLHLAVSSPPSPDKIGRLSGRITAQARRVDLISAGGVYVEPVMGRPRRVQGRVIAVDAGNKTITVKAVATFTCKLDARQQADQFPIGAMVSFDVERGALFEPI